MQALIIDTHHTDNAFSPDHREAAIFSFIKQYGQTKDAVYLYDPEMQPPLSIQAGDTVQLHGWEDQHGNLHVSHCSYLVPASSHTTIG